MVVKYVLTDNALTRPITDDREEVIPTESRPNDLAPNPGRVLIFSPWIEDA